MAKQQSFLCLVITIFVCFIVVAFETKQVEGALNGDGWGNARATFYGDQTGGETMRKLYLYYTYITIITLKILVSIVIKAK